MNQSFSVFRFSCLCNGITEKLYQIQFKVFKYLTIILFHFNVEVHKFITVIIRGYHWGVNLDKSTFDFESNLMLSCAWTQIALVAEFSIWFIAFQKPLKDCSKIHTAFQEIKIHRNEN